MPERKQYSTSAIPDVKSVYSAIDEITASAICALTILHSLAFENRVRQKGLARF